MNATTCPFDAALRHYWERLSDAERRMRLDEEGLYSLTPQSIALEIASWVSGSTVFDAFCGAGGLAIALARRGKQVTTCDIDSARLDMARHNATLFGVADRIDFRLGNCLSIMPAIRTDAVVLDPPWGGSDYKRLQAFRFDNFSPDGEVLLEAAFEVTHDIVLRLPKNFHLRELERFGRRYHLQQNLLAGRLLHYCVYFSDTFDAGQPAGLEYSC